MLFFGLCVYIYIYLHYLCVHIWEIIYIYIYHGPSLLSLKATKASNGQVCKNMPFQCFCFFTGVLCHQYVFSCYGQSGHGARNMPMHIGAGGVCHTAHVVCISSVPQISALSFFLPCHPMVFSGFATSLCGLYFPLAFLFILEFALLCFALLCFALLCFALLCFALLCFALLWHSFASNCTHGATVAFCDSSVPQISALSFFLPCHPMVFSGFATSLCGLYFPLAFLFILEFAFALLWHSFASNCTHGVTVAFCDSSVPQISALSFFLPCHPMVFSGFATSLCGLYFPLAFLFILEFAFALLWHSFASNCTHGAAVAFCDSSVPQISALSFFLPCHPMVFSGFATSLCGLYFPLAFLFILEFALLCFCFALLCFALAFFCFKLHTWCDGGVLWFKRAADLSIVVLHEISDTCDKVAYIRQRCMSTLVVCCQTCPMSNVGASKWGLCFVNHIKNQNNKVFMNLEQAKWHQPSIPLRDHLERKQILPDFGSEGHNRKQDAASWPGSPGKLPCLWRRSRPLLTEGGPFENHGPKRHWPSFRVTTTRRLQVAAEHRQTELVLGALLIARFFPRHRVSHILFEAEMEIACNRQSRILALTASVARSMNLIGNPGNLLIFSLAPIADINFS